MDSSTRHADTTAAARPSHGAAWALGAAALLVVAALVWVVRTQYGWALVRGPEYEAAFTDVAGLTQGDDVRYAGLVVGRVRRVTIDSANPARALVTFRVRAETPVRANTRAAVVAASVGPASYVSLRPDPAPAPALAAGARLPSVEAGPTVEQALLRTVALLDRVDTLLVAAGPLAGGDFFAHLGRTVARLDTLVGAAAESADRWGPRLEAVVRRTDRVLARTDRVLAALDSAGPALRAVPVEAAATLQETRTLLADMRSGVEAGGGLDEVMRDLAATGDNLARLTHRLERDPVSLLQRRRNPPKPAGPRLPE